MDGAPSQRADEGSAAARPEVGRADVHVGRDGWLFLVGGTNRVLAQYRRGPGAWRHDWAWRRLIERRALRCWRLGTRYLHVVVPEKLTVYDDRLDGLAVDTRGAPARRVARWLRLSPARRALVDLVEPLRAARGGEPLYLRTDSHWTAAGAEVAARAICRHLGAPARDDLLGDRPGERAPEVTISGDLGSKLDPPACETLRPPVLPREAVRHAVNGLVAHYEARDRLPWLHTGALVVFRNESARADPRRIVLFGDSYAHFLWTLRTGMLTGLLAERFREVHFLWSPSIDWAYVRRVRPDVVIGEIAERFTAKLPGWAYDSAWLSEFLVRRELEGAAAGRDAA